MNELRTQKSRQKESSVEKMIKSPIGILTLEFLIQYVSKYIFLCKQLDIYNISVNFINLIQNDYIYAFKKIKFTKLAKSKIFQNLDKVGCLPTLNCLL